MPPISLRSRIVLGFSIPLVVTGAIALGMWSSLERVRHDDAAVAHGYAVLGGASELLRLSIDAETGVRGLAITGDESFLRPYELAVARFRPEAARLEDLVADDRLQVARVARARELFGSWRVFAEEVVARARAERRTGGGTPDDAERLIASGRGKRTVDEIRREIGALVTAEEERMSVRLDRGQRSVRVARAVAVGGPLLAIVLAMSIALRLHLRIARGVHAVVAAADGFAAGDLARRAEETGADEIGRLAVRFNAMADRIERRNRETALLAEMSDLLQSCASTEEALATAGGVCGRLFPGERGELFTISAGGHTLEPVARWGGVASDGVPVELSPEDCWALRRGAPHRVDTDTSATRCAHVDPTDNAAAHLCVPLVAQGDTFGVLHVSAVSSKPSDGGPYLTEPRVRVIETVAEQLSLALGNLRLRTRLREQSVRDPLTGLYNRRYLEETLERELRRADRVGRGLGVVLFDLDHFKRFNDTHGHEAGDALLREVGSAIVEAIRQGDVACRYGGEEFVLLVTDSGIAGTLAAVGKVRDAIREVEVVAGGRTVGAATASFGVAVFPDHGTGAATLLRLADAAMYRAKQSGRDRVEIGPVPM